MLLAVLGACSLIWSIGHYVDAGIDFIFFVNLFIPIAIVIQKHLNSRKEVVGWESYFVVVWSWLVSFWFILDVAANRRLKLFYYLLYISFILYLSTKTLKMNGGAHEASTVMFWLFSSYFAVLFVFFVGASLCEMSSLILEYPYLMNIFLCLSCIHLIAVSLYFVIMFTRQTIDTLRHSKLPSRHTILLFLLIFGCGVAIWGYSGSQNHIEVFQLLDVQNLDKDHLSKLTQQSEYIRSTLVNSALSVYLYPVSTEELKNWSSLFRNEFVLQFISSVASPLVYQGDFKADMDKAVNLYKEFFGKCFFSAERYQIIQLNPKDLNSVPTPWTSSLKLYNLFHFQHSQIIMETQILYSISSYFYDLFVDFKEWILSLPSKATSFFDFLYHDTISTMKKVGTFFYNLWKDLKHLVTVLFKEIWRTIPHLIEFITSIPSKLYKILYDLITHFKNYAQSKYTDFIEFIASSPRKIYYIWNSSVESLYQFFKDVVDYITDIPVRIKQTIEANIVYHYITNPGDFLIQIQNTTTHLFQDGSQLISQISNKVFSLGSDFVFWVRSNSFDDLENILYRIIRIFMNIVNKMYAFYQDRNTPEGESSVISIDAHNIWISHQDVQLKDFIMVNNSIPVATIELQESYEYYSNRHYEIFYSFELPKTAVIVNLTLWTESEGVQSAVISPRGAAQKTYKTDLNRPFKNSALLEQYGEYSYILKISTRNAMKVKVMWAYQVFGDTEGFTLPKLIEKRNVYWDLDTETLILGKRQQNMWRLNSDWWIKKRILLSDIENREAKVQFLPLSSKYWNDTVISFISGKKDFKPTKELKVAFILDRSKTMMDDVENIEQVFSNLKIVAEQTPKLSLDLLLSSTKWHGNHILETQFQSYDLSKEIFAGGLSKDQIFQQFYDYLKTSQKTYDAYIFVTTHSDTSQGLQSVLNANVPHFILQVDSNSEEYSDSLSDFIVSSGGSISRDLYEILLQLQFRNIIHIGGISFHHFESHNSTYNSTFDKLLSRQYLKFLSQTNTSLDIMHKICKEHHVVSTYSSMVVTMSTDILQKNENEKEKFTRSKHNEDQVFKWRKKSVPNYYMDSEEPQMVAVKENLEMMESVEDQESQEEELQKEDLGYYIPSSAFKFDLRFFGFILLLQLIMAINT